MGGEIRGESLTMRKINPDNIATCQFCGKKMMGKSLAKHAKQFHGDLVKPDPVAPPLPEGYVEIISQEAVEKLKNHAIDKNGFLISMDIIPESNYIDSSKIVYRSIKSLRPSKRKKT